MCILLQVGRCPDSKLVQISRAVFRYFVLFANILWVNSVSDVFYELCSLSCFPRILKRSSLDNSTLIVRSEIC